MRYIVGPLVANNANLNGNSFCAGQVSPSAALGFAGALLRHCGYETWDFRVLPIFHSVSLSAGRQRAAPSAKNGRLKDIEIPEKLSGEVQFTLIIDTPHSIDQRKIPAALARMRFSGGVLSTRDDRPLHSKFLSILGATIEDIKPMVQRGFALVPARDHVGADVVSAGEALSLNQIDRLLRTKRGIGGGYLVATPVGYRLLEDPESASPREGGRDQETKHVYSEPCVGLGEYISIRSQRIVKLNETDLSRYMWGWACDETHRHTMFSKFHLTSINS